MNFGNVFTNSFKGVIVHMESPHPLDIIKYCVLVCNVQYAKYRIYSILLGVAIKILPFPFTVHFCISKKTLT